MVWASTSTVTQGQPALCDQQFKPPAQEVFAGCLRLQLFRQLSLGLTLWEFTQPTHPSTATLLPRKGNLGGMRNLFRRPRCPAAWLTHERCPRGCRLSLWNFGGFSDFPSQPYPQQKRWMFQFTGRTKKSRQSKPKAGWAELFNRPKPKVRNSSTQLSNCGGQEVPKTHWNGVWPPESCEGN